jgi:hypothetical protein
LVEADCSRKRGGDWAGALALALVGGDRFLE